MDPTGELIHHRLYRDSWIEINHEGNTVYIKDLRILEGRNLEDLVIVDNAVISFAHQIDNGIPILPFREDKSDTEFLDLIHLMKDISNEKDCRNFVKRAFKLSDIMGTDTESYAHLYEFSESDEDSIEEDPLDIFVKCQRSMSMSLQKRESDTKTKKKTKGKKKVRTSLKNMKKVKSVYIREEGGMEGNYSAMQLGSQKCITPGEKLNSFLKPSIENDKYSDCVHLE